MPSMLHEMGVGFFNQQQYALAENHFLRALAENPAESENYFFLGQCYFFLEEWQKAIHAFKEYIPLNQDILNTVTEAWNILGQCYTKIEKFDEAKPCYANAIAINPEFASAWHNRGILYTQLAQNTLEDNFQESLEYFEQAKTFLAEALKICSHPAFLNSLASWYEKYVEALQQSAEQSLENVSNHFQLAIGYYQQALENCGEKEKALQDIIRSNLIECLAQYGHFWYKAENYPQAKKLYLDTIELDPLHLTVLSQLGMCFVKEKNFAEARLWFLTIMARTDDTQELADANLNIANTYRLEKDWDKAEIALVRAKELAPDDPAIQEEEKKLREEKAQEQAQKALINAPQKMFQNPENAAAAAGIQHELANLQL